MESAIQNINCPTDDIAAFIDGELNFVSELEMEGHFAKCPACSAELNRQKDFLRNLDISLSLETELELPQDFAKHIVANAESTVSGLRRPREQFNALFIVAGLLVFVLFAMGAEAGTLFEKFSSLIDKLAAVGGIFAHLAYSFFVGLIVILRSAASQFQFGGISAVIFLSFFFAVFSLFVSRKVLSTHRA